MKLLNYIKITMVAILCFLSSSPNIFSTSAEEVKVNETYSLYQDQDHGAGSMEIPEGAADAQQPMGTRNFYDLREDIVLEVNQSDLKSISYINAAYMASENFSFSAQFLDQSKKMKERESVVRKLCNIAEGTNVAQLCIYGLYNDTPEWKCVEIFDAKKQCKGCFYLSGNDPAQLSPEAKKHSLLIDVQRVSHGKGYMEIRQRPQALLETIRYTVQFLEKTGEFIENPTREALLLEDQARSKNKEIIELTETKNQIINEFQNHILHLHKISGVPGTLIYSTHKFMIGILSELITCLSGDDFNFYGMKHAINNENLKELISSIQEKLSERKLSEVFNSKHFNLGCSEPLLLFDLFNGELNKASLIREISKVLFNKNLVGIVAQLHSTKTPCRSCLIGCCGHTLQGGVVSSFFESIRKNFEETRKKNALPEGENIKFRFLISYDTFYEDIYPFYIPIVSDLHFNPSSILIVNMKFYNEHFIMMKKRIIQEYRKKIENLLLTKLQENGCLTSDDLKLM